MNARRDSTPSVGWHIRLSVKLRDRVDKVCRVRRVSRAYVVEEALKMYLDDLDKNHPLPKEK